MAKNHVLAIVLAGGEGKRLMPLTMDRAKPAVPFGGHFRLIDFSLSNMVNSGYMKIVVLTQYKSHSLDRHVTRTWYTSPLLGNFIAPVPAQQRRGPHWYLGSADAIYQSLNIVDDENPDYIVITGADNIYRMDFSQMVEHHIESGLPATVAGIRQPIELAPSLGVIEGKDGHVDKFVEKPQNPQGLPDNPNQVLASMGNYVFTTAELIAALREDAEDPLSKHDMANMDLISVHPVFNLYNRDWPTMTLLDGSLPPAKFVYGDEHSRMGHAVDSFVSPGVIISGGEVYHSIISPNTYVHSWAQVTDSVIMNGTRVGRHAIVSKTILDKGVVVEEGAVVGVDLEHDLERGFTVTESGITVVPKGVVVTR